VHLQGDLNSGVSEEGKTGVPHIEVWFQGPAAFRASKTWLQSPGAPVAMSTASLVTRGKKYAGRVVFLEGQSVIDWRTPHDER